MRRKVGRRGAGRGRTPWSGQVDPDTGERRLYRVLQLAERGEMPPPVSGEGAQREALTWGLAAKQPTGGRGRMRGASGS